MKISILGGRRQFADFLRHIPESEVNVFQKFDELLHHAEEDTQSAIFILPDYEVGKMSHEEFPECEIERLAKIITQTKIIRHLTYFLLVIHSKQI
jgi:hypothetical protein